MLFPLDFGTCFLNGTIPVGEETAADKMDNVNDAFNTFYCLFPIHNKTDNIYFVNEKDFFCEGRYINKNSWFSYIEIWIKIFINIIKKNLLSSIGDKL